MMLEASIMTFQCHFYKTHRLYKIAVVLSPLSERGSSPRGPCTADMPLGINNTSLYLHCKRLYCSYIDLVSSRRV